MAEEQARIVYLDDNEDLRELIRGLLEPALKVECACFGSLMEFQNHSKEVLRAKVAILDINLGPNAPTGIDAFNWLMDHGFQGKVLFLTGHARIYLEELAERNRTEILEKPCDPATLVSVVQRALKETQ